MATALTTGYSNLITPGLRKVWFSTLESIPKEGRQLFNIIGASPGPNAPLNFFDDLQVKSLNTFGAKPQGEAVSYDVPEEGNTVRLTPYTFGKGFRITEELAEDELYGVMKRMTRQLAMAAAHQLEVQMFRILNGGFATTGGGTGNTAAGFDSLALFSTSHTLINQGTTYRQNRAGTLGGASADLDLSHTAVEQALDIFEGWKNHSNMPEPKRAQTLVVDATVNKWIAKEITQSELKPYTGNNEVNALGGEGLEVFLAHYLTDTDSWFLLSPKAEHTLTAWMRRAPRFAIGDDFDSGDMKAKGTFRIATGFFEPDGTFGSQGA